MTESARWEASLTWSLSFAVDVRGAVEACRITVEAVARLDRELRRQVRAFPEERLDDRLVPEAPYTAYTQFIGVTQHNLYHAGQISLLKRTLARA
jgi:hypothetical protein